MANNNDAVSDNKSEELLVIEEFVKELEETPTTRVFQNCFWKKIKANQLILMDEQTVHFCGYKGDKPHNQRKNMKRTLDDNQIPYIKIKFSTVPAQYQPIFASKFPTSSRPVDRSKLEMTFVTGAAFKELLMIAQNPKAKQFRQSLVTVHDAHIETLAKLSLSENKNIQYEMKINQYEAKLNEYEAKLSCYESVRKQPKIHNKIASLPIVFKDDFVAEFYREMFPNFTWHTRNKCIPNDCNIQRRPDYILYLPNHVIILEVDENQHKGYDNECEASRLNEISTALNDVHTIYIRFNPDKYTLNGQRVNGCFFKENNTLKVNEEALRSRLKVVHEKVLYFCDFDNVTSVLKNDLIKQFFLFFDE